MRTTYKILSFFALLFVLALPQVSFAISMANPPSVRDVIEQTGAAPQQSPTQQTAQNQDANSQGLVNPLQVGSLPELLYALLHAIVYLGSIALVLALVWVGFRFVAAQGNETEITKAREALMWTVIGGIILLGIQGISMIIVNTAQSL